MNDPIKILEDEHEVILKVLDTLDVFASKKNSLPDYDRGADILYFLKTYADGVHHGKEEALLFPAMEAKGFSAQNGPTAIMRQEHDVGRSLVVGMKEELQASIRQNAAVSALFRQRAASFSGLLREHIEKENHCLFAMAREALTAGELGTLGERFAKADGENFPDAVRKRCLDIAGPIPTRNESPCGCC